MNRISAMNNNSLNTIMSNVDVTFAVCLFNAARYIEETLSCIVNQSMQNFNLIIVDDCSTDNSVELVKDFFKSHIRQYELVVFQKNQGIAASREYVLEHTGTKYLAFMDADDCPNPTFIEKLYNKIVSDDEFMIVCCNHEFIGENGEKLRGGYYFNDFLTKETFIKKAEKGELIALSPEAMYNCELARFVGGFSCKGFPEGKPRYQDFAEDTDLATRMSDLYTKNKYIITIPEILCKHRICSESLSSTNNLGMELRFKHIQENLNRRRADRKEVNFIEFMNQFPNEEYEKLRKQKYISHNLRLSYFALQHGKIFSSMFLFVKCFRYYRYVLYTIWTYLHALKYYRHSSIEDIEKK